MSMIQDFASIHARKYGKEVFFSDTTGDTSFSEFEGWELVAVPDGRVLDALPLPSFGSVDRISSGLLLMETFA